MILDTNLQVGVNFNAAAVVGLNNMPRIIDLGANAKNPFTGEDVNVVFIVKTAFASAGAATVNFLVVTDNQDPLAVDGTAIQHASTGPIPVALLVVGARFVITLPPLGRLTDRYLGCLVQTLVATTTAGRVDAYITTDEAFPDTWAASIDSQN